MCILVLLDEESSWHSEHRRLLTSIPVKLGPVLEV